MDLDFQNEEQISFDKRSKEEEKEDEESGGKEQSIQPKWTKEDWLGFVHSLIPFCL
jgi:hypothetical protein